MSVLVTTLTVIILCQFSVIVFLMTGRGDGHGKLSRTKQSDVVRASPISHEFQGHHASIVDALLSRANASIFDSAINSTLHIEAANVSLEIYEGVAVTTFLGGPKVRNDDSWIINIQTVKYSQWFYDHQLKYFKKVD